MRAIELDVTVHTMIKVMSIMTMGSQVFVPCIYTPDHTLTTLHTEAGDN